MRVDLCWFGESPPHWELGATVESSMDIVHVARVMDAHSRSDADAMLFWDSELGIPHINEAWLEARGADVVHAGLLLGTAGAPAIIDFVTPTWMWNADPSAAIAATSWRMSLRACLIRTEVLRQLGGIHTGFENLDGAALELGHRYLTRGAFVRHDPALCPRMADVPVVPVVPTLHDNLVFAKLRFGRFWARWALGRAVLTGTFPRDALRVAPRAFSVPTPPTATFLREERPQAPDSSATVSVIIPTIDRYPYLRQLLPQIALQTHPVHEVIIVDQTPDTSRAREIQSEFAQLPLRVVYQDKPGQCTARNHALGIATGTHALFVDDDDEIAPDLVECHLRTMAAYGVDVCCGIADEVGAGPIPEYQRFLRASDVFPTNNTMIRRSILGTSGMFDIVFDRKMCEDGDLGTRLYLAGALMILDPRISVLHHHAPRGGLHTHRARVATYASSRIKLRDRNLPHPSEIYLALRYFSPRQVKEMLVLRSLGTLRSKGSTLHQLMKVAYGAAVFPDTLRKVWRAERGARELFSNGPLIPPYAE